MDCPVCKVPLRKVRSRSLEIDMCPRCKGKWYDDGEFTEYVRALSESGVVEAERSRLFVRREVRRACKSQEGTRYCPSCQIVMKKFNYAYDSNVFLDKCMACRGMWADKGESSQVAAHMKVDPRAKAVAEGIIKDHREREGYADLGELNRIPLFAWFFLPRLILPLADDAPRNKFPYVTIAIIMVCVIVFLVQLSVGLEDRGFLWDYGFVPADFFGIGLITSMFLHAGWLHLGGNMFFLWLFGDNIEDKMSRFGFFWFFLLCGVVADVVHGVFNLGSEIPCIGASGAISGIMGAYLLFFPRARIKTLFFYRIVRVPAVFFLGLWLFLQFFDFAVSRMTDITSVAWLAHIGGFVFGALYAYIYMKVTESKIEANNEYRLVKEE
ncbi:MAG: rhomboid family intramembrane serine protease [Planctomycetes bacterium]|nr:rhomboid family intramembrane serine protease [Planctomycetota bacterium]